MKQDIRVFFINGLPQFVGEMVDGVIIEPLMMILSQNGNGVSLQALSQVCLYPEKNPAEMNVAGPYCSYEASSSLVSDYLSRRREIVAQRSGVVVPFLKSLGH